MFAFRLLQLIGRHARGRAVDQCLLNSQGHRYLVQSRCYSSPSTAEQARRPRKAWTSSENQRLDELLADGLSKREVAAKLDRSFESVQTQCFRLKKFAQGHRSASHSTIRRVPTSNMGWTTSDKQRLYELLEKGLTKREVAAELDRSLASVKAYCARLRRLPSARRTVPAWTPAEDDTLRALIHAGQPTSEMQEALPTRSFYAINKRRQLLRDSVSAGRPLSYGDSPVAWDTEQDRILEQNCKTALSTAEIANTMSRSINSIRQRCYVLSLRLLKSKGGKAWSHDEVEKLHRLRTEGLPLPSIAAQLQRTVPAVRVKIHRLENRKEHGEATRFPWTAEEHALLSDMKRQGASHAEIGIKLPHRTLESFNGQIRKLRLKERRQANSQSASTTPSHEHVQQQQ